MINKMIGSVSGKVNASGDNLTVDSDALFQATSTNNIAIGLNALNSTGAAALRNIGIGTDALTALTTGDDNICIGVEAGDQLTTANRNTAIGSYALSACTEAGGNTAIGHSAGLLIGTSDATGTDNTIIGAYAFDAADGNERQNVVIGKGAGGAINASPSDDNVIIGYLAGLGGTGDMSSCVAIGTYAMDGSGTNDQSGTVAIGHSALSSLTSADGNIALGFEALKVHTTGHRNTAIGYKAMNDTDSGGTALGSIDNIFMGYHTGSGTWADAASNYNVAIGNYSMDDNLSGALGNTAVGYNTLSGITTGDYNVAIGSLAGDGMIDGSNNTIVGYESLSAVAGSNNVAMGYRAGYVNTGTANVAIGYASMFTSTTLDSCVAMGNNALYTAGGDDDADGTVAIGYGAGYSYVPSGGAAATGGTTLIGYNAGNDSGDAAHGLTTGIQNTAVGHETLGANANAALTGNANTVMGYRAGYGLTGAVAYNTFMGLLSGSATTTGSNNTFVGSSSGDAVTEGSGNISVGYSSDNAAVNHYQTALGNSAITQNSYETRIGMHGGFQFYSVQATVAKSDATNDTAAILNPIFKIPAGAVIKSVTAVVVTLSDLGTAVFSIFMSDDASRTDGQTFTNGVELLGAGEATTISYTSSSASDIVASSGGVLNASWYSEPKLNGLSSADRYVYAANAGTGNGDTDPSTAPVIRICVEFVGQD